MLLLLTALFAAPAPVAPAKSTPAQMIIRNTKKLKDHECPEIESYGDAPPDMPEE